MVDNNTVIAPFANKTYQLKHAPASGSPVEWEAINDFGTTSKTFIQKMN